MAPTLIFARSGSGDDFFLVIVLLLLMRDRTDRIFKDEHATRPIYTPLLAFARRARDTVTRRANRRVGEMGDNKHEKAQA